MGLAKLGHINLIKTVIRVGNLTLKNVPDGEELIEVAYENGHFDLCDTLREYGIEI